jgi:hypothetical protein
MSEQVERQGAEECSQLHHQLVELQRVTLAEFSLKLESLTPRKSVGFPAGQTFRSRQHGAVNKRAHYHSQHTRAHPYLHSMSMS